MINDFDTIDPYNLNDFSNFADQSLIDLFHGNSLASFERYYIYIEMLNRGLTDEIIAQGQQADQGFQPGLHDEFALFGFKMGFFTSGGFARWGHVALYFSVIFLPGIIGLALDEIFVNYLRLPNFKAIPFVLISISLLFTVLYLSDSLTSARVILTNYRIGVQRSLLRLIPLPTKWQKIDDAVFINNLHFVNILPIKIFFGISTKKELLTATQLWFSLIGTKNTSKPLFISLNIEKSIFLFEALSLVVKKNGGLAYNIPLCVENNSHGKNCLRVNYRFKGCNTEDFLCLLKSSSHFELFNDQRKAYYGISNLARLALYATGDIRNESGRYTPVYLSNILRPGEYVLTFLPLKNDSLCKSHYAVFTTYRLIIVDRSNRKIINFYDFKHSMNLTPKWINGQVIFKINDTDIFKAPQRLMDFPVYDVLNIMEAHIAGRNS